MFLEPFGPFADAFTSEELDVPGYLESLHLQNRGAQVVIDRIENALSLIGALRFVDPNFPEGLVERISSSCPISVPDGSSPAEGHSATGPAGTIARSAKLLASLLCVGTPVPKLSSWFDGVRGQPRVADVLRHDDDDAPGIADRKLASQVWHH